MGLIHAIQWRWPGAQCVVRGDALERWDGPMAQPTPAEIAQAVADFTPDLQPKFVNTRELIRRFTQPERARIRALARTNDNVGDLRDEMLAGSDTNVNDPRFVAGLESLKAGLIPSVWADDAAANARIAAIRA